MNVKLVATMPSGLHAKGTHITDPDHVDRLQNGASRKRFVRVAVHLGDEPFVSTNADNQPEPTNQTAPAPMLAPMGMHEDDAAAQADNH